MADVSGDQCPVVSHRSRGNAQVWIGQRRPLTLELAADLSVALGRFSIEWEDARVGEKLHRALIEIGPVDPGGAVGKLANRHGRGALLSRRDLRESRQQ